jgi:AAA domain
MRGRPDPQALGDELMRFIEGKETVPLDAYSDEPAAQGNGHDQKPAILPPRSTLDFPSLDQRGAPPAREWALEHWLPLHQATLLAGRGGVGKTLAAQHLGTAMALGLPWVDAIRKPLRVLFWAGEDDADELWRRQIGICGHFGVSLAALDGLFYVQSYEAVDITLAAQIYGLLQPTLMLAELTSQIRDYQIDYVFLDNIARIYGGNENDRHQVTQFLSWLAAACHPAGVCLLGHPAKSIGSEYSGSTAWEGAVRARLYLSDRLPDVPVDEDEPPDEAVRYLSRRKSNYSANDWRRLELKNGVLIPQMPSILTDMCAGRGPSGDFAKDIVKRALRRLTEMRLTCNASTRSPEYLPRLANQYGLLENLAEKRFGAIMRDCLKAGDLVVAQVAQYQNRTPKMGLVIKI